jgi:hypothetical protein
MKERPAIGEGSERGNETAIGDVLLALGSRLIRFGPRAQRHSRLPHLCPLIDVSMVEPLQYLHTAKFRRKRC